MPNSAKYLHGAGEDAIRHALAHATAPIDCNGQPLTNTSIEATTIPDGAISTAKLAPAALAANAAGRMKMADGFVTTAKMADAAITGPKIAATAFRYFDSVSGRNGTGGTGPVTLTGAKVGDRVHAVIPLGGSTGGRGSFEQTITVADQIQQSALTDLSTSSFDITLLVQS